MYSNPIKYPAVGNPAIPVAQPHLCIAGKIVHLKYLLALHQAASVPPYLAYLKQKFHWMDCNANNVHWAILHLSLSSFHPEDQRQLLLLIHDKFPLHNSKAHLHSRSSMCPSCQCHQEDAWHFLECTNPEHMALFATLKQQLGQLTQTFHLHPCTLMAL